MLVSNINKSRWGNLRRMADRKALLFWQVIRLLMYDGYFLYNFTENRLRNL